MMAPFPICHSEAAEASALLAFTLGHFITFMLMTLTRDAADAGKPECGVWGPLWGVGLWVNTSQLLGLAASAQPARLRELSRRGS